MNLNKSFFKKKNIYIYILYSALFLSSFNIILNFIEKVVLGERLIFGDFSVYRCGAITFLNNINPYEPNALAECLNSFTNALDFFYPPLTLNFFQLFSNISHINSLLFWGLIIVPILLFKILLTQKLFLKEKNIFIYILIYFFSFGGLNFTGLLTGNISVLFYSLFGIGFYYALIKKKIIYIYIVLICMCLFKITYIIFLVLFFFLEKRNYFKLLFLSLFIIFILYFSSYTINQELFLNFLNHLNYIRSDEFYNLYGGGFGLYSIINNLPNLVIPGYEDNYLIKQIIWVFISGLFLVSAFFLIYDKYKHLNKLQILSFGILTITICYPVIKDYEGFLLVPSIYFLLFNLNFKTIFQNKEELIRYILVFFTFSVHDKYALFLIAIIIFFYINFLNFKNLKIFKTIN